MKGETVQIQSSIFKLNEDPGLHINGSLGHVADGAFICQFRYQYVLFLLLKETKDRIFMLQIKMR